MNGKQLFGTLMNNVGAEGKRWDDLTPGTRQAYEKTAKAFQPMPQITLSAERIDLAEPAPLDAIWAEVHALERDLVAWGVEEITIAPIAHMPAYIEFTRDKTIYGVKVRRSREGDTPAEQWVNGWKNRAKMIRRAFEAAKCGQEAFKAALKAYAIPAWRALLPRRLGGLDPIVDQKLFKAVKHQQKLEDKIVLRFDAEVNEGA